MTLPASRIGDKGQRYQVEAEGYPRPGWSPVGWSDDKAWAQRMSDAVKKAPACTGSRIVDRKAKS